VATVTTAFGPEQGLRFINTFDLPWASLAAEQTPAAQTPAPLGWLRLPKTLHPGRLVVGLCGGMCFAALDYYHAGRPAPAADTPPRPGTPLYHYLWARQWDSLGGLAGIARIVGWMLRRGEAVARRTMAREWPRLAARLVDGEPAVLLLVRAGGLADPTQNHQVVVWGYDRDDATGRVSLRLYDPNHPPRDAAAPPPRIEFTPRESGPVAAVEIVDLRQTTGEPLRGFFVLDYQPATADLPPA
jgi:hypothetical protein